MTGANVTGWAERRVHEDGRLPTEGRVPVRHPRCRRSNRGHDESEDDPTLGGHGRDVAAPRSRLEGEGLAELRTSTPS